MGKTYQSPHDPDDPYNGLPVTILESRMIRRVDGGSDDELLIVQFPGGHTSTAWADEITDD